MPEVTIAIPSYNCAADLPASVGSALAQTWRDLEILIVDDGSTDDTRAVVAGLPEQDRIRYVWQENRGLAGVRNALVREARGTYVVMLDADDLLPPHSVEAHVEKMRAEQSTWAVCDIVRRRNGVDALESGYMPRDNALEYCLVERFPARAICYRRDVYQRVGPYDTRLTLFEDWDLYARLLEGGEPFSYIDRPAYIYNLREDSMTKGQPCRHLVWKEFVYRRHYGPLLRSHPRVRRAYAHFMFQLAREYRECRQPLGHIARALLASVASDPGQLLRLIRRKLRLGP